MRGGGAVGSTRDAVYCYFGSTRSAALGMEAVLRESDFGCGRYVCDDPSSIPMWLVLLLVILLALLIVSVLQPKAKEPPPLKKAVDDVLKGYQEQAETWGDSEAKTAFGQAREKVAGVIDRYESRPI